MLKLSYIITKWLQDETVANPSSGKPGVGKRDKTPPKGLGLQDLPTSQPSAKTLGRDILRRRPVERCLRRDPEVLKRPELEKATSRAGSPLQKV